LLPPYYGMNCKAATSHRATKETSPHSALVSILDSAADRSGICIAISHYWIVAIEISKIAKIRGRDGENGGKKGRKGFVSLKRGRRKPTN
jgi:hypothetical protein